MESVEIREPEETDWPAILAVNESVARIPGAGPQDEWLRNRRGFDRSKGVQQQLIANASGSLVGYAALESGDRGMPRSFRLFVVCAPHPEFKDHAHHRICHGEHNMMDPTARRISSRARLC